LRSPLAALLPAVFVQTSDTAADCYQQQPAADYPGN
jgi:hypothetical protein